MTDEIDYYAVLVDALDKFGTLSQKQTELAAEQAKLRQLIYAISNMLSDAQRLTFQTELSEIAAQLGGLTDAVREALKLATQRRTYFTAVQVRDHLSSIGFDFSQYSSNPLASINTTIKRFKPSEIESTIANGVSAYRWIFRFPRELDATKAEKIKQAKDRGGLHHDFRPGTHIEKKNE